MFVAEDIGAADDTDDVVVGVLTGDALEILALLKSVFIHLCSRHSRALIRDLCKKNNLISKM